MVPGESVVKISPPLTLTIKKDIMLSDLTDRILEEEVIDHIDSSELNALRSRRDLRLIDIFLGNRNAKCSGSQLSR